MRAVCPISYAPKGSLTGRIDQLSQLVGLRPKFRSNGTGRKEEAREFRVRYAPVYAFLLDRPDLCARYSRQLCTHIWSR